MLLTVAVSACLQDEGALVRAARNLGFVFSGRTPDSVIVDAVSDPQHSRRFSEESIQLMFHLGGPA